MFDTVLRILIASTGYSEEDPHSSLDETSPAALRAVDRLKQMALDFDQLRDSILPLGVDPATQTWGMEKVLEDVRMAEEGSPASVIKYNLGDEQKATFLNGILDLCGYVCQPSTGRTDTTTTSTDTTGTTGGDVVIDIASAAPATSPPVTPVSLPSDQDLMEGIEND